MAARDEAAPVHRPDKVKAVKKSVVLGNRTGSGMNAGCTTRVGNGYGCNTPGASLHEGIGNLKPALRADAHFGTEPVFQRNM